MLNTMNLYYIKINEDYIATEGYPEEEEYLVVANNETEALETAKKDFLELRNEDDWAGYTGRYIAKWDFIYTGDKTDPFVQCRL